ncbi:MAG: hypothetical protein OEY67_08860 [Gammaproteobacteria bacterium]|nr:hypothetical protein [Gammaproteobacteria bacterium]
MVILEEKTLINTSQEELFRWFEQLPKHYRSWHPDHVECRYLKGNMICRGAVLYVEEYLHGELHRLKLRVTNVVPNREIHYRVTPGIRGGFYFTARGSGSTVFEAYLHFGWNLRIFNQWFDGVLKSLLSDILPELKQHMHEEGINLKKYIELNRNSYTG